MVTFLSDFSAASLCCSDFVFDPGGAFSLIMVCVVLKVLLHTCSRLWWIPWDRGRHIRIQMKLLHNLFSNQNPTLILKLSKVTAMPRNKSHFCCVFSNHLRFVIRIFRILFQKRVFGRNRFCCGLSLNFWLSLHLQKCVWVCMITFESCLVATSNFG